MAKVIFMHFDKDTDGIYDAKIGEPIVRLAKEKMYLLITAKAKIIVNVLFLLKISLTKSLQATWKMKNLIF